MRSTWTRGGLAFVVAALTIVALSAPAGAFGASGYQEVFPDLDKRTGSIAPTAAQLNTVKGMGAIATWNRFGTPSTMVRTGKEFLATGVAGTSAVEAARNWLNANKALFRLGSLSGLEVINDSRLGDSDGHSVIFRQTFGGLKAAEDGMISVGVKGSPAAGWKVAFASSSATGDSGLAAQPVLTSKAAWLAAAANVGLAVSFADVRATKVRRGWEYFNVKGFSHPQQVRLVALPTPQNGVRPVFETMILNNQAGLTTAFAHYIDAVSGAVLLRKNTVEHSHPPADAFTGSIPPTDSTGPAPCDVDKGPWDIDPGEEPDAIVVQVTADVPIPDHDVTFHIKKDDVIVFSQDLLFSPEVAVYDPPGLVPAGVYEVQVCDFEDGIDWIPPVNTYTGQIFFNPVGGPATPISPFVARWSVFPASGELPTILGDPWGIPDADTRKVWCWDKEGPAPGYVPNPGCSDYEVENLASRVPWDVLPPGGSTFTTIGNNANSAEAWFSSTLTPGGTHYRPVSQSRDYTPGGGLTPANFTFENAWEVSDCPPVAESAGVPVVTPGDFPNRNDIDAAVVNLFAMHNRMHDWSYFLGFTEEHWNYQFENLSGQGLELDNVLGDAQAGAGIYVPPGAPVANRDNANWVPTPDGTPGVTNMYLWQPLAGAFYAPCVDGDYDMYVIGHEYGHGIENRMVAKGSTRGGHHAGAMGESFGDLFAVEYINEFGFAPPGQNPFAMGAYATGSIERGIRNYPLDKMVQNFSNMGYDNTGPQVHADGEIWSATNFEIRRDLIEWTETVFGISASDAALQRKCAEGKDTWDHCPGNRRWIQILFDGMLLVGTTAPSMIDMRNAYIGGDLLRTGGVHTQPLWEAFAHKGFGVNASSDNSASNDDSNPKPDFESPASPPAQITFQAVDADTGNPIGGARIYVGDYEARTSPIADTDPSTGNDAGPGDDNLDDTANFRGGDYELFAHAPGYGHVRASVSWPYGATGTYTFVMARNWASRHPAPSSAVMTGASIAPGSDCLTFPPPPGPTPADNCDFLIDDTEATNTAVIVPNPTSSLGNLVAGKQVTVDLAGADPINVTRVQVSAMIFGNPRFVPLRAFKIYACVDTLLLPCSTPGAFGSPIFTSAPDAFPGEVPRPVVPELILREFDVPDTVATHIRIEVVDNQCTGNPRFQDPGNPVTTDQDSDPLNETDCRAGDPKLFPLELGGVPTLLLPRNNEVRISELQVFASDSGVVNAADPVVALTKLGPATAKAGQQVTYTISYANVGSAASEAAGIVDRLPGNLEFVSASNGGTYDAANRAVVWNLGSVGAGVKDKVTLTARIHPDAKPGTVVKNTATFGGALTTSAPTAVAATVVIP